MKNPNQKSLDELLDVLDSEAEEASGFESNTDPYLALISKYDLKPGDDKVDWRILYKLFKNTHGITVKSREFKLNMGLYFENDGQPSLTKYLLNRTGIALTEALNKELRARKQARVNLPKIREHFESFMQAKGVKQGDYWVEGVVLYYLYDEHCFKRRKRPRLGYVGFIEFCRIYLKNKKPNARAQLVFRIDPKAAGLTQERLTLIQEWGKKFHAKRRRIRKKANKT